MINLGIPDIEDVTIDITIYMIPSYKLPKGESFKEITKVSSSII